MRRGFTSGSVAGLQACWVCSPLFPVPGPKACMRTGDRLAPRGHASSERLGASTNIDGGRDAYFRERDDKKNCFHINKII